MVTGYESRCEELDKAKTIRAELAAMVTGYESRCEGGPYVGAVR